MTKKRMLPCIEHLPCALCYVWLLYFMRQPQEAGTSTVRARRGAHTTHPSDSWPLLVLLPLGGSRPVAPWPLADGVHSGPCLALKKDFNPQDKVPRPPVTHGCFPSSPCRAEEVPVRHLLPVWPDPGYPGFPKPEDEGPGLCHLQGGQQRHQRPALHAGLPLLRQAHGEHCGCGGCARTAVLRQTGWVWASRLPPSSPLKSAVPLAVCQHSLFFVLGWGWRTHSAPRW